MQEKEWQKITVTDIVNRCELNRGTFYAHYANVAAVMEQIQNEMIAGIDELIEQRRNALDSGEEPRSLLHNIASYAESDIEFMRLIATAKGSEQFHEYLKELLTQKILESNLEKVPDEKRAAFEIAVRFTAGGFTSLFFDWFRGKVDVTLEETCDIVGKLMEKTFKPYSEA